MPGSLFFTETIHKKKEIQVSDCGSCEGSFDESLGGLWAMNKNKIPKKNHGLST